MSEILDARAAVEQILDDCAAEGGWQNLVLPVDAADVRACLRRQAAVHLAGGLP